jgi:hypothetical protein
MIFPDNIANGVRFQREVSVALIIESVRVTSPENITNGVKVQSNVTSPDNIANGVWV